ncbi:MAG: hypothetical protein AABX51_06460 [Nanoarchaeota archaeon]
MGFVIAQSIRANDKVEFRVVVDYDEALSLQGHATNVHIFSEDAPSHQSKLVSRGRAGETKYLLVPKAAKKNLNTRLPVQCQRIETDSKTILIYTIQK